MEISFRTRKLAKKFNSESELSKNFGAQNAKRIMRRMAVLAAAPTLANVPVTKPERRHELSGKREGEYAVDVEEKRRIIFKPDHDPVPEKEDGGIDLERVTSIEILSVENYHS